MKTSFDKFLITGASGFVGSHVVRTLFKAGKKVIAIIRKDSKPWRLNQILDQINITYMDLLDPKGIDKVISECHPDVVIHCAAYGVDQSEQDSRLATEINVTGTNDLLEACVKNGISRFVHIGSSFEYGDVPHQISEDEPLRPLVMYGSSKASASMLVQDRFRTLGIQGVILRPFSLWGRYEGIHRLVPQIVRACIEKNPLKLTNCEQIRDYTYVTDMAEAIISVATHKAFPANETINLGSGKPIRLKDFVISIARILNGEALMEFGVLEYRKCDVFHLVPDVNKQLKLIGPIPKVSIEQGIKEMLLDYPNHELTFSKA